MCRHRITKPPIKSITLDSIIGKLVENFGADEKQAWNARMAQKVADEPYRKLEEMIRTAKEKKLKFLDISQKWSPAERKTFADGVAFVFAMFVCREACAFSLVVLPQAL
jgi:hypothetical protein